MSYTPEVLNSDGGIDLTVTNGAAVSGETSELNTPAVSGYSTNGGEGVRGQSVGGAGVSGASDTGAALEGSSATGPGLHVNVSDAGHTTKLALLHRDDNLGLEVQNDGGLTWTSPTGKDTTKAALDLSGTNTGDQTTVTGNAGTATALATSRNIDGQAFNGTADITVIAPGTHAATSKATPVDADELPIVDSAASNVLKKLTWANLKATLKTYLDTLYAAITKPKINQLFLISPGGAVAWTNMASALGGFNGVVAAAAMDQDLTGYTQVRFTIIMGSVGGNTGSKAILRYKRTSFSSTATDYSDIGTSEVSVSIATSGVVVTTGWVALAAGAKADVWIAVLGSGGDGAIDPTFRLIKAEYQ